MRRILIAGLVFSVFLCSCGDNSKEGTKVLLTYNRPTNARTLDFNLYILITDEEGATVDEMDVSNLDSFEFFGPESMDRYTLTIVRTDQEEFLLVKTYLDVNASLLNNALFGSINPIQADKNVNIEVGESIEELTVSSSTR